MSQQRYDVFLSFRGADTGEGFADSLFEFLGAAGLNVFMYDEELHAGESIQKAIYESKLFVPIFSQGYASCERCLEEITWMVNCMEEFPMEKEMLPVFYNVDARDVKLETGLYNKVLVEHKNTSGHETVEKWRKALIKVPQLKGWNRSDVKGLGKFIRQITDDIGRMLERRRRILPDHFIGIEEQVRDVMNLLDSGSSGMHVVVIPGMGRIGKTTTASAVFREICWKLQGCSFLSKVRESTMANTVADLRNRLQGEMMRFSSSNSKDIIFTLDNLADTNQMRKLIGMGDSAGEGTGVIITTRNLNCPANAEEMENNVAVQQSRKIYALAAQLIALEKCGEKYDVFLSFRGGDTRESFTDCLFEFLKKSGLNVFMDDEELRVGESIVGGIQEAIYDSKLFVPILSWGYASSKWCLKEMAWMMDCLEEFSGKKEMIPIFYDVHASDVKLQTDLYSKALVEHEQTSGNETVKRWRKALIKVPTVKGWNRNDAKGQGKFITQITQHISNRLKLKPRILPNHLIGIEDRIQSIMDLLDCGSRDVRAVAIVGPGGIGKTTLATAVFNRVCWKFQGCSFLSNVTKIAAGNGMINLQKKLLEDMFLFPSHGDGHVSKNSIKDSLRNKDVLIVLDDVSEIEQLRKLIGDGEWFGEGSRVIITTRFTSVARFMNIEDVSISQEKNIYLYQVRQLEFEAALELLCLHAFDKHAPPSDYAQLSLDILQFTRGFPLFIEVLGSCLRWKNAAIWKEMLNKLNKVSHEHPIESEFQVMLMSSYEMLSEEEKEIFLDIALFFAGHDKTNAFSYWEACGLIPETSIVTLINYALVRVDDSNRLYMHDLLENITRKLVHKTSIENIGRCNDKDRKHLSQERKETNYIEALELELNQAYNSIPADPFVIYQRFLEIEGDFVFNGLSELRWLSWRHCPLDFHRAIIHFENLVVLRLSESNITEHWAVWEQFKTARNLKVLELEGLDLTTTPDLSSFVCLEKLEVRQCPSLVRVDPSIGNLQFLNSLVMINPQCWSRGICPNESRHSSLHLPSSICDLKLLSRLVIEGFEMTQLPENIGKLKRLKIMEIRACKSLSNLPDSIGELESLCKLHLDGDGITELPESISKLGNLTELNVSNNRLRRLPLTIGDLGRLEMLDISHNSDLQGEIPRQFVNLHSLKFVNLSGTGICGLS